MRFQRLLLFAGVVLTFAGAASAQDFAESDRGLSLRPARFRGRPNARDARFGPRGTFRRDDVDQGPFRSEPIVGEGWVFIDGEYVAPPYVVTDDTETIAINGRPIGAAAAEYVSQSVVEEGDETTSRSPGRRNRSGRRRGRDVARFLEHSRVVLLTWDDRPPVVLPETGTGLNVLKWLADESHETNTAAGILQHVPDDQRDTVAAWLAGFRPPTDLSQRAQATVRLYRETEDANIRQITAVRRLESLNYPLSVAGMVLCAFAFGHLLRSHPEENSEALPSAKDKRLVYRSLGLAVAFSVLDLVWTLLALQANAMRELNPIAGGLIHSPFGLAVFKIVFTAMAVGIISMLWRHRVAQVASWWACLILALLTVRWLTFHSVVT